MFVLVFALVFVWYGIKFVQFGWDQNSELAELPMPLIFVAWPLAGFTWLAVPRREDSVADLRMLLGARPRSGAHERRRRCCRRRSPRWSCSACSSR